MENVTALCKIGFGWIHFVEWNTKPDIFSSIFNCIESVRV